LIGLIESIEPIELIDGFGVFVAGGTSLVEVVDSPLSRTNVRSSTYLLG
jgi:hypothetical protein